jgi:opacity protein-like surface antigen
MRRRWLIGLCIAAAAGAAASDGDFKAGGHIAYTAHSNVGGNSFGAGGQFVARVNDAMSLEIAGTYFNEQDRDLRGGVTTVALTARVGKTVAEGAKLYLGVGPNFNVFALSDLSPSVGYHFCAGTELELGRGFEFMADYRFSTSKTAGLGDNDRYSFGLVRLGLGRDI